MNADVKLSKPAVIGAANGVMFMTFFGALWASIGVVGSKTVGAPWTLILSCIVTIVLLVGSISIFGKARTMNSSLTAEASEQWKKTNRKFGLVFGLEGLAIFIASVICNLIDHFELFFPIMAIIVGIHFLPLAQLFRERFYYVTGIVLCALGLITFFLPMEVTLGDDSLIMKSTVIGFGSAIMLWVTGFRIWIMSNKRV